MQGGGADQAHPDGRGGEAHPPPPSRRHCNAGGGHRQRDRRRPLHLRLRHRLSQSFLLDPARSHPRRPSCAAARSPRFHLEVLERRCAVRLGRQALAGQARPGYAASVQGAAHADSNGDRHRGDDRARRRARLYAPVRAARASRLHPPESRPLRPCRPGRGTEVPTREDHGGALRLHRGFPARGDGRSAPRGELRARLPDQARTDQYPQGQLQRAIQERCGHLRRSRRCRHVFHRQARRCRARAARALRGVRRLRDTADRRRQGLGEPGQAQALDAALHGRGRAAVARPRASARA